MPLYGFVQLSAVLTYSEQSWYWQYVYYEATFVNLFCNLNLFFYKHSETEQVLECQFKSYLEVLRFIHMCG